DRGDVPRVLVIEAVLGQGLVIRVGHGRGLLAHLHREVEHRPLARGDVRVAVVDGDLVRDVRVLREDPQDGSVGHDAVEAAVGRRGRGHDHLPVRLREAAGLLLHERVVVGEERAELRGPAGQAQEHVGDEAGLLRYLEDLLPDIAGHVIDVCIGVAHDATVATWITFSEDGPRDADAGEAARCVRSPEQRPARFPESGQSSSRSRKTSMRITIGSDRSRLITQAADAVEELVRTTPDAVLGIATGSSPEPLYAELTTRAERGLDLSHLRITCLDDYVGLSADHPQSYRHYIREHVLLPWGIDPSTAVLPEGDAADPDAAAADF